MNANTWLKNLPEYDCPNCGIKSILNMNVLNVLVILAIKLKLLNFRKNLEKTLKKLMN